MFKRISILVLTCLLVLSFLNAASYPTAVAQVTLDTSKMEYFECGFTTDENPRPPYEEVSTYAIGTGGITPAKNIDITATTTSSGLDIKSGIYTIWVFKIGSRKVNVELTGDPLILESYIIPYDVYISTNDPSLESKPALSVSNISQSANITDANMDDTFVKFWTTKFMLRVPRIPANVISGTYKGSLKLTVTAL